MQESECLWILKVIRNSAWGLIASALHCWFERGLKWQDKRGFRTFPLLPFRSKAESKTRNSSIRPILTFRMMLWKYQRKQAEIQVGSSAWSQKKLRGGEGMLFSDRFSEKEMSNQVTEAKIPLLPYRLQSLPISLLICQKSINAEEQKMN